MCFHFPVDIYVLSNCMIYYVSISLPTCFQNMMIKISIKKFHRQAPTQESLKCLICWYIVAKVQYTFQDHVKTRNNLVLY